MMLTYAFTVIITASWAAKTVAQKKFEVRKTPLDKFLFLFLISQFLSTVFSIDTHVSIFGYYSRFHQGLLATISYLILYFAFTTNFPKEKIKNLLYSSIAAAAIVSAWGIFEHFGHSPSCLIITGQFDVNCWVQDVATRVYATLGQPNWMSAYLAILIPITIGLAVNNNNYLNIKYLILSPLFYLAFLFTRSRSGFVALWFGLAIFALFLFKKYFKIVILFTVILLSLTFIFGSGISQIDRFALSNFPNNKSVQPEYSAPALESGGTESGYIRTIVWKGALDILRHYPVFGSGVETFAFSYYKFRPVEHNAVSEWEFLYNKAHNEYLNFLATTGLFGFLTYLSFIIAFIFLFFKNSQLSIVNFSLFAGWITILVTNFFGFSVVAVALFFYLIPAMIFVNGQDKPSFRTAKFEINSPFPIALIIIITLFLFNLLIKMYLADLDYAAGSNLAKNQKNKEAYLFLSSAIDKNPMEPIYHDEISTVLANLSVSFATEKDEESAEKFASLALKESDIATTISPNNITFYKNKTKMYYTLSQIDQSFIARTIDSLNKASELAPTDPKIKYNLSLLYSKNNEIEKAVKIMEDAVALKPDYRETRYALAIYYKDLGENAKAIEQLNYILQNINPNDSEAKEKLVDF